ncbi:hypothetical protein [Dyella silvae]|uniref:hypothetical protein n=1 Tax=Dyella silvae TaxID=2994424 RepID=UPI002265365B|nr:hypothetical protein [Dyella silvae]
MRMLMAAVLCACLGLISFAGHADDLRKQVVASTLVTGTVKISPEGKVDGYTIDQAAKLPPAARDLLDKNIPAWTFERTITLPVDITERMTIRLLAKAVDDKHDTISIVSASFDDDFKSVDETVHSDKRVQPLYPGISLNARVTGTVYTLVLVGKDGHTEKAIAEQVNLRTAVPTVAQERFRKDLGYAATKALQSWTWHVPTSGRSASNSSWWVRVPVVFSIHVYGTPEPKQPGPGDWDVYIPGPRVVVTAGEGGSDAHAQASDAIADGTVHLADSSVKLTTPLGGG